MPKGIKGFQVGHETSSETRRKIGQALNRQVEFLCDNCGLPGSDKPSSYARKRRHFCSQYCYTKFRSELLPKWEHNAFGSGNSPEERAKRVKTRSDLNHALRSRLLERPMFCQATDGCPGKPEGHHDSYDKPLEVRWLCFQHHRDWHYKTGLYENPELLK